MKVRTFTIQVDKQVKTCLLYKKIFIKRRKINYEAY